MGPETSVTEYKSTLRNIPEERKCYADPVRHIVSLDLERYCDVADDNDDNDDDDDKNEDDYDDDSMVSPFFGKETYCSVRCSLIGVYFRRVSKFKLNV